MKEKYSTEDKMYIFIRDRYDLRKSDTEKVLEKIFNFIENECLEWNHISCQWEIK